MNELSEMGASVVTHIATQLLPSGIGDDTRQRYTISGLIFYITGAEFSGNFGTYAMKGEVNIEQWISSRLYGKKEVSHSEIFVKIIQKFVIISSCSKQLNYDLSTVKKNICI